MLYKTKIYMIGPLPPPAGGISVHVKRLCETLNSDGFRVEVYEDSAVAYNSLRIKLKRLAGLKTGSPGIVQIDEISQYAKCFPGNYKIEYVRSIPLLMMKIIFDAYGENKIIHYHTKIWKYRALICFMCRLNKNIRSVFTIHSLRDDFEKLTFLEKFFLKYTVRNSAFLIAVNENIREKLIKWGAQESRISVIPAFLPPVKENQAELPAKIKDFIAGKKPVLTANASGIKIIDGKEIYGVKRTVELCAGLKKTYPDVGIVFCLSKINEQKYYSAMLELIKEYGLENNFLFFTEQCDYFRVLQSSDVFLRPTYTDGDALSVREALYLGVKTVVSDAVERPEGCVLYNSESPDDFLKKTEENLPANKIGPEIRLDCYKHIKDVYETLFEKCENAAMENSLHPYRKYTGC